MKDVVGYEGRYGVDADGNVWSHLKNRMLLGSIAQVGYRYVSLRKNGTTKVSLVHRLVAEAFIKNPAGRRTVNHIDGDKQNNAVGNLEWATDSEQQWHALSTGLSSNSGERHYMARMTSADVEEVLSLRDIVAPKHLALRYGVTSCHISDILAGRRRCGNVITR